MNSKIRGLVGKLSKNDKLNNDGIRVDRKSIWGNPYVVTDQMPRDQAIAGFTIWLSEQPALLKRIDSLRGKKLYCHCSPNRCHAEILALVANKVYTIDELAKKAHASLTQPYKHMRLCGEFITYLGPHLLDHDHLEVDEDIAAEWAWDIDNPDDDSESHDSIDDLVCLPAGSEDSDIEVQDNDAPDMSVYSARVRIEADNHILQRILTA